jgi:uncharacterized protein YoxC
MSLDLERGVVPNGPRIRQLLLQSTDPCPSMLPSTCRRYLSGVLNVDRAVSLITKKELKMSLNEPNMDAHSGSTLPDVTRTHESSTSSSPQFRPPAEQDGISTLDERRGPSCVSPSLSRIEPSACACGGAATTGQFVFAFGKIGIGFSSRARYDSICQHMYETSDGPFSKPFEVGKFLAYLEQHPWDATSVIWTLALENVPVYAISAGGPNSAHVIQYLKNFLQEQNAEKIDRVSIAGVLGGRISLMSGELLPVIHPDLRGTSSWKTDALLKDAHLLLENNVRRMGEDVRLLEQNVQLLKDEVQLLERKGRTLQKNVDKLAGVKKTEWALNDLEEALQKLANAQRDLATAQKLTGAQQKMAALRRKATPIREALLQVLDRVYFGRRNLGLAPRDRAINYLATNVFLLEQALEDAQQENMKLQLHSIDAVPSPVCRAGSDCWDVKLEYFFPDEKTDTARQVWRITVDVSDVVPVTVGKLRFWPSAD